MVSASVDCAPTWLRALAAARQGDWAVPFDLLRAEYSGGLVVGPGGHAILPEPIDHPVAGGNGMEVLDVAVPGLVALRVGSPARPDRGWATALAGLRLGLSYALLDQALAYLGARRVAGGPLLGQQLVKGDVADVVLAQLEIQAALDVVGPDLLSWPAAVDLHRQITGSDRRLLRLFGASGYLADGPGTTAYTSELLADVYIGPDPGAAA